MADAVVIGSGNAHKVAEIRDLLAGLPWDVRGLGDFPPLEEPEETGATFAENASLKAAYYARRLGLPCIADDSGIVVDALEGAPGVYSARYAGPACDDRANNAKLLVALKEVRPEERTARFVCCAAIAGMPGEDLVTLEGRVEGRIADGEYGGNGFGYDPLFIPEGHDRTFGQLDPAIKQGISHRARAMRQVRDWLEARV